MNVSQMPLGRVDVIQDPAYLGAVRQFDHKDHSDPDSVTPLSAAKISARLVLNDSGGALSPGKGVIYKAAYTGKRIGNTHSANAICHGVVDPYLTADVANGSYFWLIEDGPIDQLLAGTGGLTAGDLLQTGASGTFVTGTAGTNPIGHCGYAEETFIATAKGQAWLNLPFALCH